MRILDVLQTFSIYFSLNDILLGVNRMKFKILFLLFLVAATQPAQAQLTCQYKAYVFLSPTCPMCIGYAHELNRLQRDYKSAGLELIGVFPNYYVTDAEIDSFRLLYQIDFTTLRDSNFVLTNQFKATTTPEIFLMDAQGEILYRGQIDNTYFRAGKRRGRMTEQYFRNAVQAILEGRKPSFSETQPIGCAIVRN